MAKSQSDSAPEGIDPIAAFRLSVVERYMPELNDPWWDVLVELNGTSLEDLAKTVDDDEDLKGSLIIPNLYGDAERKARPNVQYLTVYARKPFLQASNRRDNSLGVTRMLLGAVVPDDEMAAGAGILPADFPKILVPDGTVITAVIDNGIAFAHELFRKADLAKSRVAFAWIMDAKPEPADTLAVPRGRALTRAEIDASLGQCMSAGLLDENKFYRKCGLIDYSWPTFKSAALRVSHGTHVMGIAAGYEPGENVEKRPIICVQLPTDEVMDVSGTELLPSLGQAIQFIKQLARRFRFQSDPGKRVPLVVNFSYGNFAGPHDGTGIVEKAIDHKLKPTARMERQVVLPAGNGNLARAHAEITFLNPDGDTTGGADGVATLDWRILPDDRTASIVEIWMPFRENPADMVTVRVTPPGGPKSNPVSTVPGSSEPLRSADGDTVGRLEYTSPTSPTNRGLITVGANPTFNHDVTAGLAPSGVWKIEITNASLTEIEPVQVWIRRDDTLPGFPPLGRQSYFDNACYDRFDAFGAPMPTDPPGSACIVRRSGTISGFACGSRPAVLAGFVEGNGELAVYSAAGPITTAFDQLDPHRTGPDAAAVSDDSSVMYGVLSAGSHSGTLVALNGTSVAAPQAARWMANQLAAGLSGNRAAVRLKAEADDPDFVPPPKPRASRIGGGRMHRTVRFGPDRTGRHDTPP